MFSIIGDSNVVDNMTSFNTASRDVMQRAQVLDCPGLNDLATVLQEIRYYLFFKSVL